MVSLVESFSSGDRLRGLQALRDNLAGRVEGAESNRDAAQLAGQLVQVLKQIEELDKGRAVHTSKVDELAERRRLRAKPIRNGNQREA